MVRTVEVFTTTSHVNGGGRVEMAFRGVLTVSCRIDFNSWSGLNDVAIAGNPIVLLK